LIWQSRFACALQCPWQSAWHFTSQDALGGVPVQLALHLPPQHALHDASQSASAPPSVVCAEH
jgi:hypothetical protein